VALNFSSLFHLSYLTTSSLGNNDAVNYALVGKHLAHNGFSDPGPIVGYDLGAFGRTDGFGSTALIGAYSAITGIAAWRLTSVVVLLVVSVAIALLVMLSHYAFMAFFGPPVLFPALVLADNAPHLSWRSIGRRLGRLVVVFGAAALLAIVIVPQWLWVAYDR